MNGKPEDQLILYQTEDGETRVQVMMQDETVWLTQKQLVELFQRDKSVISRHINNVFKEGELAREATVANFATVQHLFCRPLLWAAASQTQDRNNYQGVAG
jgi:hypothetical protein